ncbi:sigma-70 family RNA polymerase sigma factor [Streptomyces sp. AK02-04a]|uniref:RNA polymerase sigma factor n=1 Tax=Streptomyces sp. AK02-04a TaxID=3028649 RepID=UPI0029A4EE60|nr:sigma-70 family RNA polymerase sigma factor [Streptomyces sp. AK02-04a]MDX3763427.1 sigma-70 family RNA polymerase sigma factor [Streptomyces sp. AK02-04a]
MSHLTGRNTQQVGRSDRAAAEFETGESSDQTLAQAVRDGDTEAFAALFLRHRNAATRLASMYADDAHTAQDFVAEAFSRVLQALRSGGGPSSSFRSYLLKVLRNVVAEWGRNTGRQVYVPDVSIYEVECSNSAGCEALKNYEHGLVIEALASLSDGWRTVLWYTIVQSQQPAAIAKMMGVSPNSVAALAYRAKEGLRQAYLTAHLDQKRYPSQCSYYVSRLAALSRGRLGECTSVEVMQHVADCNTCGNLYQEIDELNQLFRA